MTLQACAALVERGDPDRFLAAMSAPPEARAVLFPLYAFNLEVARAPYVTEEPTIAEMRLQWWRDALEEIDAGREPRAHEVAAPLAGVIRGRALPVRLLDEAVAARRWDAHREPFSDEVEFAEHLERTSGNLMWLAALGLGARPEQESAVRDAAWAMGMANWFRAVPELEARGRYPLPDGRPEAVRALAQRGLERLRSARRASFGPAIPAVRAAWRAPSILKLAAKQPGRVAAGRLERSEFRRRAALVWAAARGGW